MMHNRHFPNELFSKGGGYFPEDGLRMNQIIDHLKQKRYLPVGLHRTRNSRMMGDLINNQGSMLKLLYDIGYFGPTHGTSTK